MEIIFVTSNLHKLEEAKGILGQEYNLLSIKDVGVTEDICECESTLEGNALLKARYVWEKFKRSCFADDTGLEVYSLSGNPGVRSARYAGDECNSHKNREKLLKEMVGKSDRKARFRTVVALIIEGEEYLFEGILNGTISQEPNGNLGFGYDPIFIPDGATNTLAQISFEEKNLLSHRGTALRALAGFLEKR